MSKKLLFLLIILAVSVAWLSAQDQDSDDDYSGIAAYTTGEQLFTVNAGPIIPLFNWAPNPEAGTDYIVPLSNLSVGAAGSLNWGAFVADNLLLGVDISGMIGWTANRTLSMVPISFRTAYYFLYYPFEFPVYIDAGFSFNSLGDFFTITPCLRPGFGAYWNINGEWALGLSTEYWFMPEIYFDAATANQTRVANFLQISISAVYHF